MTSNIPVFFKVRNIFLKYSGSGFSSLVSSKRIFPSQSDKSGKKFVFLAELRAICVSRVVKDYRRGIRGNRRGFPPRTGHFLVTSQNQYLYD